MFATVRLNAILDRPGRGLTISFDPSVANDPTAAQYIPAVTTGIRYAWEKVRGFARPDRAVVTVLEIGVLMVDTTEISVLYASSLAMWDALNLHPKEPIIGGISGRCRSESRLPVQKTSPTARIAAV